MSCAWEKKWSERRKRHYYYNRISGERQWKCPSEQLPDATSGCSEEPTASQIIAKHYDAVCAYDSRATSVVLGSRQLNNWVKQIILDACVSSISRVHPLRKQPLTFIDIACGRGGDVGKVARATEAAEIDLNSYGGVDVSPAAVQEAEMRSRKLLRPHVNRTFAVCDLSACNFSTLLTTSSGGRIVTHASRLVWCSFALHYFFASSRHMESVLEGVARALCKGGLFAATYADGNLIMKLAREAVVAQQLVPPSEAKISVQSLDLQGIQDPWFEFESKWWRVRMPWRTFLEMNKGECPYTLKYRFWMPARCSDPQQYVVNGDLVEEYLVIDDVLIDQAAQHNMRLVFETRNENILRHARRTAHGLSLLDAMKVSYMKDDGGTPVFDNYNIEIISLYKTVAFCYMGEDGHRHVNSHHNPCDALGVAIAYEMGIPGACALPYPVFRREL